MVADRSPTLDKVFHALSHPARRSMLRSLARGERNLSELAKPFQMSFPAASKHVRVLEQAKLVKRRVVGREHVCRINAAPLKDVNAWIEKYRVFWEERFDRLDEYLQTLKASKPGTGKPGGKPGAKPAGKSGPGK